MRVSHQEIQRRRDRLAELMQREAYLPVSEVCRHLKISEATARRDLNHLAEAGKIIRTFGGGVADFNQRLASFQQRRKSSWALKQRLAGKAAELVPPGATLYLDGGTTVHALALHLRRKPPGPLTVVTNNLLTAEVLMEVDPFEVHLLGGRLLNRQSLILGPAAQQAASLFRYDVAFLGAEGFDSRGIWNSGPDVVGLQRVVMNQAAQHCFCLDSSKLNRQAPVLLCHWAGVEQLCTDVPRTKLRTSGIHLSPQQTL